MATVDGVGFLRITVLGLGDSGKTSLINAFVNNVMPSTQYIETDSPTLYYKMVRLPNEEEGAPPITCLVEIEDTYSSSRGDGVDRYGKKRDIQEEFLKMGRTPKADLDRQKEAVKLQGKKLNAPLGVYIEPPGDRHKPLTKNRMGFMFVFDATSTKSYQEAINLYKMLTVDLTKKKIPKLQQPRIFFVANKIDKDPLNPEMQAVLETARIFSTQVSMPFHEVSAMEFKGVKKLFRDLMRAIMTRQQLWLLDDGSGVVEEALEKAGGCTVS